MTRKRKMTHVEPPAHLSERSKALWRAVVPSLAASPQRQAAVQVALEALDRADAARRQIEAEGMVVSGGKMPHIHPLLKVEKDARQLFARLWAQLGMAADPPAHSDWWRGVAL